MRLIDISAMPHNKSQGPVAVLESFLTADMEDAENKIFMNIRCIGGPTSVREWFVDNPDEIDKDDVLYHLVQEQNFVVLNHMKQLNIDTLE